MKKRAEHMWQKVHLVEIYTKRAKEYLMSVQKIREELATSENSSGQLKNVDVFITELKQEMNRFLAAHS